MGSCISSDENLKLTSVTISYIPDDYSDYIEFMYRCSSNTGAINIIHKSDPSHASIRVNQNVPIYYDNGANFTNFHTKNMGPDKIITFKTG